MARPLCPDASVLVKLYVPEADSREARDLVAEALRGGHGLVGPGFLLAETLSVLRGKVLRGSMEPQEGEDAVDSLLGLRVEEVAGPEVYRRAWRIAGELAVPVLYDAVYLAVAELHGAEFWTADRKLYEKARGRQYVHLLGERDRPQS